MNRLVHLSRRLTVHPTISSYSSYCTSADVKRKIGELVAKEKVFVFMKGTPEAPRCGFSNAVVQILNFHGVKDYMAFDVLSDEEIRQGN